MKRFLSVLLIALCLVAFVSPAHAFHGVRMTYAASGSSGITVADNDNLDFGTGNFTLVWKGSLPDWTPSGFTAYLFWKHDSSRGYNLYITSEGKVSCGMYRNDAGTWWTSIDSANLTDGTEHEITAVVTRETASTAGSVALYVDGTLLGTRTITAAATETISNAGILYVSGCSGLRLASTNKRALTFNRALSAAEVLSLYQNGIAEADKWGSQTAKYSCTTNFSGWAVYTATNTGGQITFVTNAATWQRAYVSALTASTYGGKNIVLQYEVTANDAVGITRFYLLADDTNKINHSDIDLDTTVGVHRYYFQANPAGQCQTLMLYMAGTITSGSMVIDNVYIYETGATLALEPAGIGAASWTDSSSNGLNASYPASGYSLFYNGQRNLLGVGQ